jgi:transcriptional regulator with XRE-family HTH domain
MKIFAERLRSLREEKNLTQKDLAQILGLSSKSTITNYEKNDREPDYETLTKIAKYFEVSADYFLGLTNKKNKGETVLVEDLLQSQTCTLQALINILERKGITTRDEVLDELKNMEGPV